MGGNRVRRVIGDDLLCGRIMVKVWLRGGERVSDDMKWREGRWVGTYR